jgi:prepilin peptidase CpaA
MSAAQIVFSGLLLFTLVAAVIDFRTGHIPNRLVGYGAALGVAVHFGVHALLLRQPEQSWLELAGAASANVVMGVLACGTVPLLLYRVGAMGGGDVKLLAAVGAWGGPVLGLQIEMYAFVCAAVYAPARLAYQGQLLRLIGNSAILLTNPFRPKASRKEIPQALLTELRFGPAIFVGAALVALVRWGTE